MTCPFCTDSRCCGRGRGDLVGPSPDLLVGPIRWVTLCLQYGDQLAPSYNVARPHHLTPRLSSAHRTAVGRLQAILVFSLVQYVPAYYGTGDTKRFYPHWANWLGWSMALAPVIVVVLMAAVRIQRSKQVGKLEHDVAENAPASPQQNSNHAQRSVRRRPSATVKRLWVPRYQ